MNEVVFEITQEADGASPRPNNWRELEELRFWLQNGVTADIILQLEDACPA